MFQSFKPIEKRAANKLEVVRIWTKTSENSKVGDGTDRGNIPASPISVGQLLVTFKSAIEDLEVALELNDWSEPSREVIVGGDTLFETGIDTRIIRARGKSTLRVED
ncbi:MAG: hypothetical protein CMD56_06885, partial [Gammaproteobacteria bacterium]|nr:hypothetical protein [Gammaproteobacteria bacterium]